MKIIEALKKIKDLDRKVKDLGEKLKLHSADMSYENPVYPDQAAKIQEWTQSSLDCIREMGRLRVAIQKTNVLTPVSIVLANGENVTKPIAEWIHWRRDLAKASETVWRNQQDKNLRDGVIPQSAGGHAQVHVRRHYDPAIRDRQVELYRSQPSFIDAALEIVNATTDLIE